MPFCRAMKPSLAALGRPAFASAWATRARRPPRRSRTSCSFPDVHAEWAPNEKVALEVAAGASMGGKRALVTMKHVGLNVAADPLFTLAYTGVGAGLVILVADDPGMHSSQNEQDSRNYAAFAGVPILEPSDSAEAREMTMLGVRALRALRCTRARALIDPRVATRSPRSSHGRGESRLPPRAVRNRRREVGHDARDGAAAPAGVGRAHRTLAEYAETAEVNRVEMRSTEIGIVTSGISYQHVREALPDASVLKLGMSFPLPAAAAARLRRPKVERLYVVEEAGDYLARSIRSLGIAVTDTTAAALRRADARRAFAARSGSPEPDAARGGDRPAAPAAADVPGCPHRPVFNALRKMRAVVTGDIGCYTLGALPPLSAMDSCVCMGASIGMAHGMELAGGVEKRPVVAVIGDSTFAHSGITALMNTAYNAGTGTVLILDNRITAMTGHQGNPVNGITLERQRRASSSTSPSSPRRSAFGGCGSRTPTTWPRSRPRSRRRPRPTSSR